MGEYGYSIEHILMVDVIPDASVRSAMNEINAGEVLVSSVFLLSNALPADSGGESCVLSRFPQGEKLSHV